MLTFILLNQTALQPTSGSLIHADSGLNSNMMIKRILMIDDDAEDREIFKDVILNIDSTIEVTLEGNAAQALKELSLKPKADVIFLDLSMPGMDGIEFLTKLKADRTTRKIPAIIYTSSENQTENNLAIKLGAFEVIQKTNNLNNLSRDIKQLFSILTSHN